ncbi:MAG: hypothetical protein J5790_10805 [Bacteroidaceae bacterium]|nr:hypothetical protein [Bacteroidaceae bacterium]
MITEQDLFNIVGNKIANEIQKSIIRNNCPPHIADQICNAIDLNERAENFQRFLNEWLEYQNKQQQIVQSFLQQYYNR